MSVETQPLPGLADAHELAVAAPPRLAPTARRSSRAKSF